MGNRNGNSKECLVMVRYDKIKEVTKLVRGGKGGIGQSARIG